MSVCRKPYPSDISDEAWSLIVPYLLLQREDAGQREHDLREVFNGLRSTPESGERAGYDGAKRKKGSKIHMAMDTLGHLLALHVTSASAEDRGEIERLTRTVQAVTDGYVDIAWVDQGYTGERAASAAAGHGIALEVVKPPEAKRGFVLLPRRWVGERSFAWATRFRRPVKDYEGYAETLAVLHVVAFACLMMKQAAALAAGS